MSITQASTAPGSFSPVAVALLVLAAAITASAWLCDDAYITFRTVENFASGDGLRWNVAERVQSYTHPLWMFAISALYMVSGDVYYSSLLLSFTCSMAAVAILATRIAVSPRMALIAISPLLLSKAFVDYSTSGLENPLTHLLLALFFWRWSERWMRPTSDTACALQLGFIAGLIGLNRLDALVLVAPALGIFLLQSGGWRSRPVLAALALGTTPLLLWETFSLFYYGFPFPNTAYAKLATGAAKSALALQGLKYFADSLARDPVTLISTAAGLMVGLGSAFGSRFRVRFRIRLGFRSGSRPNTPSDPTAPQSRRLAIPLGVICYWLYVVWIGGDFMSGRFFAAPMFCVAILVSQIDTLSGKGATAAVLATLALALAAGAPTLTSGLDYGADRTAARERKNGIGDERAYYYPHTGLLRRWLGLARVEDHVWAVRGRAARDAGLSWAQGQALGFYGFYAGPRVHVLDMVGLSDPLLARIDARPSWRIGHFERKVPRGYIDTLRSGSNRIADPNLAAYYDALSRLTRDPLFDTQRLGVIARLNLGAFDALLDDYHRANQKEAK